MCLILFGLQAHPDFPLVLAANRDEFYKRPTATASFWEDAPDVLAGRDLQSGGTWLGVTRSGRLAAITNYRDLSNINPDAPTRGALVADFLMGDQAPEAYLQEIAPRAADYNGFNLLVGQGADLWYFSNYEGTVRQVTVGVHGLSNALLNTSWPKVEKGKKALNRLLTEEAFEPNVLLDMLRDTERAPDAALPSTGIPLALERDLSPMFIETPKYGSRSSSVIVWGADGQLHFTERTHVGSYEGTQVSFALDTPDPLPAKPLTYVR